MKPPEALIEQDSSAQKSWLRRSPSRLEVVLLWSFAAILFVVVITHFQSYASKVDDFGDNTSYLAAASAIRHWDFHAPGVKQFWGFPYLIAAFSFLQIPPRSSLLVISIVSSLCAVLLAFRLWGPWIAAFFAVVSFSWLQVSFLGGSEPLFVVLLFSAFWARRKEQWAGASALAAFATVVRPLGIFTLAGIGLVLLFRRDYKKFFSCTSLAALIGILYVLPFWIYYHDPLYQVHQYKHNDWQSGSAIGLPFRSMVASLVSHQQPWTNTVFILAWILFAILGFVASTRATLRSYVREHPAEYIFGALYLTFLFSYNSSWAWADFPRFVIPVVPFLLVGIEPWLPKSRSLLLGLGIVSPVLGACGCDYSPVDPTAMPEVPVHTGRAGSRLRWHGTRGAVGNPVLHRAIASGGDSAPKATLSPAVQRIICEPIGPRDACVCGVGKLKLTHVVEGDRECGRPRRGQRRSRELRDGD